MMDVEWFKRPTVSSDRHSLNVKTEHGWWSADVRYDGCVHLSTYYNGCTVDDHTPDERDYIHICDLEEMIARLQALREVAIKHFAEHHGKWPE